MSAASLSRARRLLLGKHRRTDGHFLAEGPHVVAAALAHAAPVRVVYTAAGDRTDEIDALCRQAAALGVQVLELAARDLASLSDTTTPQALLAVLPIPAPVRAPLAEPGTWLLLDEVRDPGNVGTLLRAAEAFGARGVLAARGTADLWSGKVVRSAQGAHFGLELVCEAYAQGDVSSLLAAARDEGLEVWAATLDGEDIYGLRELPDRLVLALGNETRGVSDVRLGTASRHVTVPQRGDTDSLNVAMAGSVLLSWIGHCRGARA